MKIATTLLTFCMLLIWSTAVFARSPFGDWQVIMKYKGISEAFTANRSGSTFGLLCAASLDHCVFYLSAHTRCHQGHKGTVLVNASSGSIVSETNCLKLGDTYYDSVTRTRALLDIMLKSRIIGFAIPLANGRFRITRFSLKGSLNALHAVTSRSANNARQFQDLTR